jgi:hypothetical protein
VLELRCRRLAGDGGSFYRDGGGTLEFVAEVLKVFRADLRLQHFFDHLREVSQRADRTQRRRAGGDI